MAFITYDVEIAVKVRNQTGPGAASANSSVEAMAQKATAAVEQSARNQAAAYAQMNAKMEAGRQDFVKSQIRAAEQEAQGTIAAHANAARIMVNEEKQLAATMIREARAATAVRSQEAGRAAQAIVREEKFAQQSVAAISKSQLANRVADIDKFSNALKNNNTVVRKSADDFLALFGKAGNTTKEFQHAEQGAHKLGEAFKVLGASAVVAEGPMGGVSSRLRAMSTEANELTHVLSGASGMAGALIGAAAGVAILAAGVLIGGEALFSLSEKTAKFGDDVFKAHEKTALSVETLSALKIAGAEVGVELSTMTTGLVRFTQNLEKAASGNKKLRDEFKQLGVTAFHDNDTALQQFITNFARLRTEQERTVAAGEVFGVRFGAELVQVFNRVGGDMGKFKEELRGMHLLMSEDTARAAHEFMVSFEHMKLVLSGVGRQLGQETMPAFEAFFKVIESSLESNKQDWKNWGEGLAMTILTVESMLGGLANVLNNLSWKNFIPLYGAGKALNDFYQGFKSAADQITTNYVALTSGEAKNLGRDMSEGIVPRSRFHIAEKDPHTPKGSDPAAAAKRMAEIQLRADLDNIKIEEEAIARSLKMKEISYALYYQLITSEENDRHRTVIDGLIQEAKAVDKLRDGNAKNVANAEIETKRTIENNDHLQQQIKLNDTTLAQTRERIKLMETIEARQQTRPRRVDPLFDTSTVAQTQADALRHLEVELGNVRRQNSDDQLSQQRKLLSANTEQLDLETRIGAVQDDIAAGPYNAALRLQLTLLEATNGLNRELEQSENERAVSAETASLRYKIAWQNAQNDVVLADDRATEQIIASQAHLADAMTVHAPQIYAGVLSHLEQVKTVSQAMIEGLNGAYDKLTATVDASLNKTLHGLGLIKDMVVALVNQLLSRVFQSFLNTFLGGGGTGGQQAGGGGFFGGRGNAGGGLLGSIFGGGGQGQTGGFAGGAGILQRLLGGGAMAGAISMPASASAGGLGSVGGAGMLLGGGSAVAGAGGGLGAMLSGLGGSLGAMAPLLGLGLGASLGGSSTLGKILGGAGGLLAGGAIGALGGFGIFGAGGIAGAGGSLAFLAPLLTNPFTLAAIPAIIAAAIIIGKNKARQAAEKLNNQAHLDTLPAVYALLAKATAGGVTVDQAKAEFEQIHQQYLSSISGIKDSKTKRNALLWWDNIAGISVDPGGKTANLWVLIEAAAKAGEKAANNRARMSPVFASGGYSAVSQLIRVRPGEGWRNPGSDTVSVIPGTDLGYDSQYMYAPKGTQIIPQSQMRNTRGFARGGTVGADGGMMAPEINIDINIDKDGIATAVVRSPQFKTAVIHNVRVGRTERKL